MSIFFLFLLLDFLGLILFFLDLFLEMAGYDRKLDYHD